MRQSASNSVSRDPSNACIVWRMRRMEICNHSGHLQTQLSPERRIIVLEHVQLRVAKTTPANSALSFYSA